jgi:hypothetical protein
MSILLMLAAQALPNYYGAVPVVQPSARVCRAAYDDLSIYQSEAYGAITKRGVDYPNGTIEYPDSVIIRNAVEVAVRPYLERIRRVALDATGAECRSLQHDGENAIDIVIRAAFGKQ